VVPVRNCQTSVKILGIGACSKEIDQLLYVSVDQIVTLRVG